eukprot:6112469-Alexandrium_andersonii.AAC.1
MSASLVGSEMCIRDSFRADAERWWSAAGGDWDLFKSLLADGARVHNKSCLLYTSDAADDM